MIAIEIDPICTLQACMRGFDVDDDESALREVDILTSATGNFDAIILAHMKRMRIDAITLAHKRHTFAGNNILLFSTVTKKLAVFCDSPSGRIQETYERPRRSTYQPSLAGRRHRDRLHSRG